MAIYDHPRLLPAGDRALTIELADEISPEVNTTIRALGMALGSLHLPGLVEIVPTYRSLLVYYDPLTLPIADLEARVLGLAGAKPSSLPPPRLLEIPTHYGGEHGPDLAQECLQVHGGIGYTWEHDLHLLLRRIRSNAALLGEPTWHREQLCRVHGMGAGA